jgi:hypothetical protein
MHFNSTQFPDPAKPAVRLFTLVTMVLALLTTSCSEGEIEEVFKDIEASNWTIFPFPIKLVPVFSVDSIRYDSISIYNVSSSIHYDSTVVLTGFVFHYWENPNEVNTIREIVVDTIDFATQGTYVHKVRITKLKPNSEYQIRGMATYLVGKDTTTIGSLPVAFKTE